MSYKTATLQGGLLKWEKGIKIRFEWIKFQNKSAINLFFFNRKIVLQQSTP
jgi:hypothetical protein